MKANIQSSLLATSILSIFVFAGVAQAQPDDASNPPKIVYGQPSKNSKNSKSSRNSKNAKKHNSKSTTVKADSQVGPFVKANAPKKAKAALKADSKTDVNPVVKSEVKAPVKTEVKSGAKSDAKPVEPSKVTSTDRAANSQLPSAPVVPVAVPAAKPAKDEAVVSKLKTDIAIKPVTKADITPKIDLGNTSKEAAPKVAVGEPTKVVTVVPNKVMIVKDVVPVKAAPAKVAATKAPTAKPAPAKVVTVKTSSAKKATPAHVKISRREEGARHPVRAHARRMDRAGIITNFCISKTKHPGACMDRSADHALAKLESQETRLLNCGQIRKSEAGGDLGVETFVTSNFYRMRNNANAGLKKTLATSGRITRLEHREITLRAMLKHSRNLQRFADKVCDAKEFDAIYAVKEAGKEQAKVRSSYNPEQTSETSKQIRSNQHEPIDLLPPGLFSKSAQ